MEIKCKYGPRNLSQRYGDCMCSTCISRRNYMRLKDKVHCKLKCADKRARKYGAMCYGSDRLLLRAIYANCPQGWTVDHIVPMCKGGQHHPMNLQYMTLEENLKKSRYEVWVAAPGTTMRWQDVIGVAQ